MNNILLYSDKLSSVEYSPTHPFKPARARQMLDLLQRHSLIFEPDQKIVEYIPLKENDLYLYHTNEYVNALKNCEGGGMLLECLDFGLGTSDNPIFKGMFEFSMTASGGTFQGAEMLLDDSARFVFNPVGGFHHAMSGRAGGFCYINDNVLAIKRLRQKFDRVVYIDIDVHHGDGVQEAFYSDKNVLCISMHESGYSLFPGTGFETELGEGDGYGYNINIPLLMNSDDEVYIHAFDEIVVPVLQKFDADAVFVQVGGDAHRDDPLANLNLTTNGYDYVIKRINSLSKKILAAGGGGYNVYKTSAIWAIAWAGFCGIQPHDHYAGSVGGMMFGPESHAGTLFDEPFVVRGHKKTLCMDQAEQVIKFLKENAFPVLGL